MVSSARRSPLMNPDARELEAQRIACSYLVKGCERALFDFGLIAGETASIEAGRIDERAADIMRDVVGSWRDTLSLLCSDSISRQAMHDPQFEAAFLDGEVRGGTRRTASF